MTSYAMELNQLCIEVHDRFFENGDKRLKDLMKELHERGYVLAGADSKLQEFTFIKVRGCGLDGTENDRL